MQMKPVLQTQFGKLPDRTNEPMGADPGNCYAACIATLFEIPLKQVPQPVRGQTFQEHFEEVNEFLVNRFGVVAAIAEAVDHPGCYILVIDNTNRAGQSHAVIAEKGEIVFDPSPFHQNLEYAKRRSGYKEKATVLFLKVFA